VAAQAQKKPKTIVNRHLLRQFSCPYAGAFPLCLVFSQCNGGLIEALQQVRSRMVSCLLTGNPRSFRSASPWAVGAGGSSPAHAGTLPPFYLLPSCKCIVEALHPPLLAPVWACLVSVCLVAKPLHRSPRLISVDWYRSPPVQHTVQIT
jgi:hypothetical protein